MAVILPDHHDAWADHVEALVVDAMREWVTGHVMPAVFPALIADGDGPDAADIAAILATTAAWEEIVARRVGPALSGIVTARAVEQLIARGVPIADLPAVAPGTVTDALDEAVEEATRALSRAGLSIPAAQVTTVAHTSTWVDFLPRIAESTANRVKYMPEAVYRDLVETLAKAARDGISPGDSARIAREFLDMTNERELRHWRHRAQTVARTETTRAVNAGELEAMKIEQDLTGEKMHKVWLCVAPDTIVGAIDVRHAARRKYVGPLVRVTTASGRELSLTPEHPVLTGRGWVEAGKLDLSDCLFQVVHAHPPGAPDVEHAPSSIGEIVDAAMNAPDAEVRAMRGGVDFDGDSAANNVEVVAVDGDLAVDLEAVVAQRVRDLHLAPADSLAHALLLRRGGSAVGAGRHRSPDGLLADTPVPIGFDDGILAARPNFSGVGTVADGNPLLAQDAAHGIATGAVAADKRGNGVAAPVISDDGFDVQVVTATGGDAEFLSGSRLLGGGGVTLEAEACTSGATANHDATGGEPAADGRGVRSDGVGDLTERVPSLVHADDLVDIERYSFVGHVYDLETGGHWYEANGLVVHNCSIDRRTRDSHFKADGQRVPVDAKFLIDGWEADHPGDENLPAHESINCRCSMLLLEADEELPDESDRQTERERADGTRRDPKAEVNRRAADGVTRARDDAPQTVTAAAEEKPMRTAWSGVLAPIDKPTGDGRIIDTDATIEFREFPLPLMYQRATSNGHDTAVVVGKITTGVVEGGAIHGTGELFDTADAAEAIELLSEGVIRPSVDMCDMVVDYTVVDADGNPVDPEADDWAPDWSETMHVRSATIMAATLVSKPAFAEAKIVLGESVDAPEDADEEAAALVASAVALAPVDQTVDSDAFTDPMLDSPTALTVTEEGRVYGHLALWGTEHVGIGRGVTPPHSRTGYALFHVSTVATDEGPVSVGRLTVGTGHAGPRDGAHAATEHYDSTGTCWALVRAGEDAHGIWVAGIINPDADAATVRAGASAPLSGDWRAVGGNLELVAALSVNTPGFPVPRSYAATSGAEMSLVAAAVVPRRSRGDELADAVAEGLRRHEARRAAEAASIERAAAARRMAAQLLAGGFRK